MWADELIHDSGNSWAETELCAAGTMLVLKRGTSRTWEFPAIVALPDHNI